MARTVRPEGLTVFSLPEGHQRRMRTANPIERAIQQEIKRRTRKIRVFPNEAALLRLATAILVEIDEEWTSTNRAYINMEDPERPNRPSSKLQTTGCSILRISSIT